MYPKLFFYNDFINTLDCFALSGSQRRSVFFGILLLIFIDTQTRRPHDG
jgi:hypothetical protein